MSIRRISWAVVLSLLAAASCGGDEEPIGPTDPPEPTRILVSPDQIELDAWGDNVRISVQVRDQYNKTMQGVAVAWTTSDSTVARVNSGGRVRSGEIGTATLTATAASLSATVSVTVTYNSQQLALVALYDSTGGENWRRRINWLTAAPLDDWYGVEATSAGLVTALELTDNELTGSIPPEFGNLSGLLFLDLSGNELSGLAAEFGNLNRLVHLSLADNDFTGPIPPQISELRSVQKLILDHNRFSGPVPPEIGSLADLNVLVLSENLGLTGPLPIELTRLRFLNALLLGGTGLCAPNEAEFREWLADIMSQRVARCEEDDGVPSAAYLVQSIQSLVYPVPLVAGKDALLRVFAVAPEAEGETIPLVRATFYVDGEEVDVVNIESGRSRIRPEVDESSLEYSAHAVIDGDLIQPGLEMVVEIDPDETMDASLGVAQRIPAEDRVPLDVRALPALKLTLIPFVLHENPDSAVLRATDDLSIHDPLLRPMRNMLPVEDIDLTVHNVVRTSTNDVFDLLEQTEAIYRAEGGDGYYMGLMSGRLSGAAGVASDVPSSTAVSRLNAGTIAHELGHNLSLYHAPCGGPEGLDPSFPNSGGAIDSWGYDPYRRALVDPETADLMTYCDPEWVSDYHYARSLRHRWELADGDTQGAGPAAAGRAILLWGGRDGDGKLHLNPAFMVDAPAGLPGAGGAYELLGTSHDGTELFRLDFDLPEAADGEGQGVFAFTVPAPDEWADALAAVTLSGPEGSFTLDAGMDRPSAMVRDPLTGQVHAILLDLPTGSTTASDVLDSVEEPGLEVLLSRGIPDAAAWRRR